MARIFISYARKDGSEVAEELADRLRAFEHDVFLDVHSIRAGTRWRFELRRRIAWSQLMIVLVTPASNESEHVRSEIALAERINRPVLPIQISDTPMPDHLKNEWQGLKMHADNYDRVLLEIEQTLRHLPVRPLTRFVLLAFALVILLAAGVIVLMQPQPVQPQTSSLATSSPDTVINSVDDLIYSEDFEDGTADDWTLQWGGDFTVIDDGTGNHVWKSNVAEVFFEPSVGWHDYAVALDYYVVDWAGGDNPGVVLSLRRQPDSVCSRYDFVLHPRDLAVGASDETCESFIFFKQTDHASTAGEWNTIYMEVRGTQLQWSVAGGDKENFTDTRYTEGSLGILNSRNTEIWFDSLRIWSFD